MHPVSDLNRSYSAYSERMRNSDWQWLGYWA